MTGNYGARTKVVLGAVLAVGVFMAGAGSARAQDQYEFFFRVTDDAGAPVTNLTPNDFVVDAGGEPATIVSAELVGGPLRLAILLDDSVGVQDYFTHVRNGLPGFIDALPDGTEMSVMTLRDRPTAFVDTTSDAAAVKEKLGDYFAQDGAATFLDALVETAAGFQEEGLSRPVIAVISGDGPEQSNSREQQIDNMAQQLLDMSATVHFLTLSTQSMGPQKAVADQVTGWNGGWNESLNSPSEAVVDKMAEMGAMVAQRFNELATQYLVAFTPPAGADPAGGFSAGVRRTDVNVLVTVDGRPPQ